MQKLILQTLLSPGDVVMLTAAVRDLHRCYPGQFQTDVRTPCMEIWENNPYSVPLKEKTRGVELIECSYPLIDQSNDTPYHCIHGYIDFLNSKLGLCIRPSAFRGDIHISELEKSWYSQVYEITRRNIPFWVIVAGGKYDVTIKWWETARFQQVVDHFRGRIQFVQLGEVGHHHPRLSNVIDLRGKTTIREFIRLIYHSQGVLCPVTAAMHFAAAVPSSQFSDGARPCVVIGGGREPAHWEAYPNHQYIQTTGALPFCAQGGCWRSRVVPVGDGDVRDNPENLCVDVTRGLPRCMDLITADAVIHRIEMYFAGGRLKYLANADKKAAFGAVRKTAKNDFDDQPLVIHNAPAAFEQAATGLPAYPGGFAGRGIVICGGGQKYFPGAWVTINMLRTLGCRLPVELWHLGAAEMTPAMKRLVEPLNVTCIDALEVRKRHPVRRLAGWPLKPYALLHSRFRQVLLLDADNVPVRDPEYLFDCAEFTQTGALFWPDRGRLKQTGLIWQNCGLKRPDGPEFESGQIALDKRVCWDALCLAMWLNEHSDFYYQYLHGDKETFHLAFEKLRRSYAVVRTPVEKLEFTMCQHDFEGRRLFQHRSMDKWNLFLTNRRVPGFQLEEECRRFIRELQQRWDGGMARYSRYLRASNKARVHRAPRLAACFVSSHPRTAIRRNIARFLQRSPGLKFHVQIDRSAPENTVAHRSNSAHRALSQLLRKTDADYILFFEDDLRVNRSFSDNLLHWPMLQSKRFAVACLSNAAIEPLAADVPNRAIVADPGTISGKQPFVISRSAARFIVQHWDEIEGPPSVRIAALASRIGPFLCHVPSLVEQVELPSCYASDYDPTWHYASGPG